MRFICEQPWLTTMAYRRADPRLKLPKWAEEARIHLAELALRTRRARVPVDGVGLPAEFARVAAALDDRDAVEFGARQASFVHSVAEG